jgi:hypothetical protein
MSRRRDLSTDISTDKKFKAENISDLAALLYTWMIPHADDFCRLLAKDPEEVNLLVWPNRKKTDEETAGCLDELLDAGLIGQEEDGHYFFPAASFYKYNTKIPADKRVVTPPLRQQKPAIRVGKEGSAAVISPEKADKRHLSAKSPEKAVSSSLSLSPLHSHLPLLIGGAGAPPSRARAELIEDSDLGWLEVEDTGTGTLRSLENADLGLGEKHPAMLCGWDRWRRLEQFWKLEGKKLAIHQVESLFMKLEEIRKSGHDPGEAVEKSLRCGWKDIYAPDREPQAVTSLQVATARALRHGLE